MILSTLSFLFLAESNLDLRGKNPQWTMCQVRLAVDAQLDPARTRKQRLRLLAKPARTAGPLIRVEQEDASVRRLMRPGELDRNGLFVEARKQHTL